MLEKNNIMITNISDIINDVEYLEGEFYDNNNKVKLKGSWVLKTNPNISANVIQVFCETYFECCKVLIYLYDNSIIKEPIDNFIQYSKKIIELYENNDHNHVLLFNNGKNIVFNNDKSMQNIFDDKSFDRMFYISSKDFLKSINNTFYTDEE